MKLPEQSPVVAIVFEHCGPYHLSRIAKAQELLQVVPLQLHERSVTYGWDSQLGVVIGLETLLPGPIQRRSLRARLRRAWHDFFERHKVDVVCVNGWGDFGSLVSIECCVEQRIPFVLMSESSARDSSRGVIKEFIKSRIVGLASAALVGGSLHAEYVAQLGLPRDRISLGYDAVDNQFFANEAAKFRLKIDGGPNVEEGKMETDCAESETNDGRQILSSTHRPVSRYFLASARFVEKKNLPFLLGSYARYRQLAAASEEGDSTTEIWNLVLLGDGTIRPQLEALCCSLGISDGVTMPGFKQYAELPRFYAHAGAFIHASTTEQWGLVVNEAMASSLPILVSNHCGCAPDLVQEGINGWTFDPSNEAQLSELMLRMATLGSEARNSLGLASAEIISHWGPQRFGEGLAQASRLALSTKPVKPSWMDSVLMKLLSR
jgi:1,2-diacylglycerol 3-alpha-glucosyltransferase